jgi:dTDP-4-dehydrorhamnose reductase
MKLLILGASSYVGSRIYFDLQDKYELVGTYHSNSGICDKFTPVDIRDKQALDKLFNTVNPDIVIHLANYSSSRQIKGNEIDFPKVNLEATSNIVSLVNKYNKKLIFFSSLSAKTKLDFYGEIKAQSEDIVKTVTAGFIIVRPSAVIGLSPVRTHNKITDKILSVINGQAQEFDNSWVLQPTYIGHLSQVIDQIAKKGIWNEELNIFTDYPVTLYQIASEILKDFGLKPNPLDTGRTVPLEKFDSQKMKLFDLSPATYNEIIAQIVSELKNPGRFQIQ